MKYRKKPVVIEAVLWEGDNHEEMDAFLGGSYGFNTDIDGVSHVEIATLEGTMRANPGDWVIKGVKGEFYPCKPDIFAATYEPIENE